MVDGGSRVSPSRGRVPGLMINSILHVIPLRTFEGLFAPVASGSDGRRRVAGVVVFKGIHGKRIGLYVALGEVHSSHSRSDLFFLVPSAAQKYRKEKDYYLDANQGKCPGNGASVAEESKR